MRLECCTCGVSARQVELGQAKVAELDLPLGIVEDVVWLQVPVDDALGVDVGQARQCLPYHLHAGHIPHHDAICPIRDGTVQNLE